MYLSKLTLDAQHPHARRDLCNPYEMHRTLARAYSTGTESPPHPFLWRLEANPPTTGSAVLLVQSAVGANWQALKAQTGYALEILPNKPVDLERLIQPGGRYRFRLQANPIVNRNGKRWGLAREEEQLAWLDRQGKQHGFQILACIRAASERLQARHATTGHRITLQSALYEGHLEAADPERLRKAILTGIGHGKAWGLGLLSVARSS
ncbi:type I-E CRISPR-associated protein Cas6/Cse3/CasE [Thiocapsa imhoffii]|uniref:Type I-E CRISPR-associated protein Cas6/Cse3/CasE n=1 Tax=Thiocapsa imhoffii TaxID=382777 RepID=A0A9X1B8B1_9GAMM|nr:type I-E CRISPR-associated protein Cas6/Cse3/CasE [Thiocapsa imhoffii]MBK1643776.1 type I-E CRISPR-associated protein Cas6/Cse3/CasE [Thiocapsa imhoffii]